MMINVDNYNIFRCINLILLYKTINLRMQKIPSIDTLLVKNDPFLTLTEFI